MRITRREWYERVNAAWPRPLPALTAEEAVRASRRLYRYGTKKTWRGDVRVTSGRNLGGIYGGTMLVNPSLGWEHLVHYLSHDVERSGHGARHARMELRMIKEVVKRGWLEGKLKVTPKPALAPRDLKAERAARLLGRATRWEAKRKRAETALKKIRRQLRYYERQAA